MTQTAPTETPQPADRRLVSIAFPAPGDDGPVDGVALVTIERPDVLNALNFDLLDELADAFAALDADSACRAIVLTGSGTRAFAAGADIKELAIQTPVSLLVDDRFAVWERIAATRTPVIAAVRGFALGGGCELAMSCDLIVAGDDAQFGQPEINLGVMPGAGGTQRLTRAIGRARAMDLILTGRNLSAPRGRDRWAWSAGWSRPTRPCRRRWTWPGPSRRSRRSRCWPPRRRSGSPRSCRCRPGCATSDGRSSPSSPADDQGEGMSAFVEKRRPEWKGR